MKGQWTLSQDSVRRHLNLLGSHEFTTVKEANVFTRDGEGWVDGSNPNASRNALRFGFYLFIAPFLGLFKFILFPKFECFFVDPSVSLSGFNVADFLLINFGMGKK